MQLKQLTATLNEFLRVDQIKDYCPNGLQVENRHQNIQKIALAVTASQEAIEQAAKMGANALIVHHGYFWKNEDPVLTNMKFERIRSLIQHDIALLAYHLPLDVHPWVGNNVELAKVLDISMTNTYKPDGQLPLLALGELKNPQKLKDFAGFCAQKLGRVPTIIEAGDHLVRKVAWCTGAAQDFILDAKLCGADLYLSGEISERTYYQAKELGIHYLACGHHATERYGIQALGTWIQHEFKIPAEFIDADNPV